MEEAKFNFEELAYRPSLLSEMPRLFAAGVLMAASLFVWNYAMQGLNPTTITILTIILLVLSLLLLLVVVWRCYNRRLCFCDLYVSLYSGILSPSLRTSRLLYHHVRGVEIEQGIIQRILNLGDIHVGSDNSRMKSEIVLVGVKNPELVKDNLLDRVRTAIEYAQHSGT
jgi:uncharacterized membrane protein YdbT with pleckstrin-like domain